MKQEIGRGSKKSRVTAPTKRPGAPTPVLSHNLFWGRGEGSFELTVLEGTWPTDVSGHAFVVGPDKRQPGEHWFHGHGLLCRIDLRARANGKIGVLLKLVDTPMKRLRDRFPQSFRTLFELLEISPFGFTNFANTNVQALEGRLFVGYDAGRPVEVDPVTLEHITPVGAVDEWAQILPGLVDPFLTIAAHPASDWDEKALYFVNYKQLIQQQDAETYLARWDLEGPVQRWRVSGMSGYDTIHDVKVTQNHVLFTDLPFVQDNAGPKRPRRPSQDHTKLWIVKKSDLRATPPGGTVEAREVIIPLPTGHLLTDYVEGPHGEITVHLQHAPGTDLTMSLKASSRVHDLDDPRCASGRCNHFVDPNYYGLPAIAPQPCVVGRYTIDPASAKVLEARTCFDVKGVWGPLLATNNQYTRDARNKPRQLFYGGLGYDPALLTEEYVHLYRGAAELVVPMAELPKQALPGGIQRFDLERMEVADVYHAPAGTFPQPPTFVPRDNAVDELDGYVIAPVHQNGAKEIHVFDAKNLAKGPFARAGAPDFCPPMMLHSYWMPERKGPRPSSYRISAARDAVGLLKSGPTEIARSIRTIARMVRREANKARGARA